MHTKSFTFGMGAGILFVTTLFFFMYGYQKNIFEAKSIVPNFEMSEQQIIEQAKKLGMAFYIMDDGDEEINNSEIIDETVQNDYLNEQSLNETETQDNDESASSEEFMTIEIPEGMIASDVAKLLAESNIVDDDKEFVRYLAQTNSTKKMVYGSFDFPYNASYEEILKIIKH